jgi:hypothetical protein
MHIFTHLKLKTSEVIHASLQDILWNESKSLL